VLQRNIKVYGPMNALNTKDSSSCWNSDSSDKQQNFVIDFKRVVKVQDLRLQFQAGFVSESVNVLLQTPDDKWIDLQELEVEDTLDIQTYALKSGEGTALKLVFDEFTDFYGRITIYRIEVWGLEVS
jgi:Sad1 / UNC-like C-terminal